jgi:hypothetical protein
MLCHLLTKTLKRPPKIQDQDFVKSCSDLLYRTYTLVIFTETHKSNLKYHFKTIYLWESKEEQLDTLIARI